MYYSFPCTYCSKVFFTYHDNKEAAASILYRGVKQHLIEYDEDRKEFQLDDAPELEINDIYYAIGELSDPPAGGYKL